MISSTGVMDMVDDDLLVTSVEMALRNMIGTRGTIVNVLDARP
jgi:hypothetical protein